MKEPVSQLELNDEFGEAMGETKEEVIGIDAMEQRPNAVIKNGGPQLLKGLMLPLPPSANRYWTSFLMVRKGTRFPFEVFSMKHLYQMVRMMNHPSKDAEAYAKSIGEYALQKGFRFFTAKPLRVDVLVCPRNKGSIDVHNYTKVLLDVLEQAGVYEDDAQIKDLRTYEGPIIKGGRVVVSMWEISPDRDALLREMWR